MRSTIIISTIVAFLGTSLVALAAPLDVTSSQNGLGTWDFNSRSVTDSTGSTLFTRRELQELSEAPNQVARAIHEYNLLETRMGKGSKKGGGSGGGKNTTKTVGQGPYEMNADDYHKNVKPAINSHFEANDPDHGLNGSNPDYNIDRKGNVQANPQNGGAGSGYTAKMKDIFPNGYHTP